MGVIVRLCYILDFGCFWHVVQILMNQADFRVLLLQNGNQVVQQSDVPIEKHSLCNHTAGRSLIYRTEALSYLLMLDLVSAILLREDTLKP